MFDNIDNYFVSTYLSCVLLHNHINKIQQYPRIYKNKKLLKVKRLKSNILEIELFNNKRNYILYKLDFKLCLYCLVYN